MTAVFKTIKPKDVQWGAMRNEIAKSLKEAGEILLKAHEDVTRTWSEPVLFKVTVSRVLVGTDKVYVRIETNDKRWHWTDKGTKPHTIRPRRAKVLVFPSQFAPKSKPGSLRAYSGRRAGPMVVARAVDHPGTKARNFSGQIAKKYGPKVRQKINEGLRRGVKATGHAIG